MDENGSEGTNESGGQLRTRLEAALAEKQDLATQLAAYKAKDVIADKGLRYVTPDDLKGVAPSEIEAKAAEIEQRKTDDRKAVLRELFLDQGVDESEVDDKVAQIISPPVESHAEQSSRIADLGKLSGTIVNDKHKDLHGEDLIYAALDEKPTKNRR